MRKVLARETENCDGTWSCPFYDFDLPERISTWYLLVTRIDHS